ncbi:MAG: protein translocase subunit SecF [Arsenophonus endosymbiont of Ceratovacuna japonica]
MVQNYTIEQLNNGRKVIDFMRYSYLSFIISIILFVFSVIFILLKGFNLGLDFTGGTIIEFHLSQSFDIDKIRECLDNNLYKELLIQNFGSSRDIIIRLPIAKGLTNQEISKSIISLIHNNIDNKLIVKRIEFIGPSIGSELLQTGIISILIALICISIYINFRFEWRLAISAIVSLVHDVIITLGLVSLFNIEVDTTIIASLMSVIGYSLNDSIVVYDRIRENFRKINYGTSYEVINISLTQTLNRTLITSGISLLMIFMLYLFGGLIIKGFSLIMLIGVTFGTISSIYIASALVLKMGIKREHFIISKINKEGIDKNPLLP